MAYLYIQESGRLGKTCLNIGKVRAMKNMETDRMINTKLFSIHSTANAGISTSHLTIAKIESIIMW